MQKIGSTSLSPIGIAKNLTVKEREEMYALVNGILLTDPYFTATEVGIWRPKRDERVKLLEKLIDWKYIELWNTTKRKGNLYHMLNRDSILALKKTIENLDQQT